MIEGRFRQYTSFLSQTPWNLVSLLEYLLPCKNELGAVSRSRARAVKILEDFDAGRLGNVGDVGKSFLGFRSKHRTSLERWGRGMDLYMNQQLFRELVGYATSLLVMQRLEAKHHLIHVACLVLGFFSLTCFHVFNVWVPIFNMIHSAFIVGSMLEVDRWKALACCLPGSACFFTQTVWLLNMGVGGGGLTVFGMKVLVLVLARFALLPQDPWAWLTCLPTSDVHYTMT